GLWYGTNDARNFAFRLPDEYPQTVQAAEVVATLLGVQHAPKEQCIEFVAKNSVRLAMTDKLESMEDKGWIGVAGSETLRALAAELKSRSGTTTFRVNNPEDIQTEEKAARAGAGALARSGCQAVIATQINVEIDPRFDLRGAKLSKMTQALAYAGIKERKKPVSRKTSDNNVKQVILAVKQEFNRIPTTAQVWMSIRHRDFSRQVKNFLWKSLHSAHRLGSFWAHIPQCEDREICHFCDETEDLEHILLKCRRPGQSLIWSAAKELWLKKHPSWPEVSLAGILGCGLATFTDDKGKSDPGADRFYRILISESAFAIWKIRNDCVIKKGGASLPIPAVHNKWLSALNIRLRFDCLLTNYEKYGKQNAIKASLVLQTWRSTLLNEGKLPENWIKEPGVLVGIEPKPPDPP
ncbi:ribonuclease H-like protein, partial [Mycena vitilis]